MPIAFLDFEAPSLGSSSFPIEVGWAVDGGGTEAHLIRPAPGWTDWSATSERLHGIAQAQPAMRWAGVPGLAMLRS